MTKCPKILKGKGFFKERLKWFFRGYSFDFEIDETSCKSCVIYNLVDIIANLRKRSYEHLILEFTDLDNPIRYIQTIKEDGYTYCVEICLITEDGKKRIIRTRAKGYQDCADIFASTIYKRQVSKYRWVDVTNELLTDREINPDNLIYFNTCWSHRYSNND